MNDQSGMGDLAAKGGQGLFATGHDGGIYAYSGQFTDQDFNALLIWASERKASDVRFQTDRQVMAEIGAQLVPVTKYPLNQAEVENIVRYVYGENGPGQIKSGYDLDPAHEVRIKHYGLRRFRVNATGIRIPGGDGIDITCRTLPTIPPPLSALEVEAEIVRNIRPRDGLVLVTGPTGSGKSTLLSSMIRHVVEKPDANEVVLEFSSPIEYVYDEVEMPSSMVAQTEVGRHLRPRDGDRNDHGALFANASRNALRRKPTVAVIGEARDKATIAGTVQLAMTGHVCYSTMHVIGVAETLRRAVQPFDGPEQAAMAVDIMQSLRLVVTQLLYPRASGGKVALREYMVFDAGTRAQFLRADPGTWPDLARRTMLGRKAVCKTMADSAYEAYDTGTLSKDWYKTIVSAQRDSA